MYALVASSDKKQRFFHFLIQFFFLGFFPASPNQIHKVSPGAGDEKSAGAKDAEDSPKTPATWSLEDTSELRRLVEGYTHGGE